MLNKILLLVIMSLFLACQGRFDVVQSGTSTTEITVSFRVIDQIKALCTAQLSTTSYSNQFEYNKAVADCVFAHLSSITSIGALNTFANQYCQPTSDLSSFTPAQIVSINTTCAALGF